MDAIIEVYVSPKCRRQRIYTDRIICNGEGFDIPLHKLDLDTWDINALDSAGPCAIRLYNLLGEIIGLGNHFSLSKSDFSIACHPQFWKIAKPHVVKAFTDAYKFDRVLVQGKLAL